MARRSPKRDMLLLLRICNEGSRLSNKTTWTSGFIYTDPMVPSKQASVYQSLSFEPDLSPQHRRPKWPFSCHTRFGCKEKSKCTKTTGSILVSSCAKGPDNIQQKCTCTDHKRAGTKVPPTSAHSLKVEWQSCSLTFAKHATPRDEKGKDAKIK
jgi:hypothetical protein